jgi:hypothetical protein
MSSATPNVQTIVAPVGKSSWNKPRMPCALTSAPIGDRAKKFLTAGTHPAGE